MTATAEELKCIEVSRKLMERILAQKIQEVRDEQRPILLTPKEFNKQMGLDKDGGISIFPVWLKLLHFLFVPFIYLLVAMEAMIIGFIEQVVQGNRKLRNKIRALEAAYTLDDEVSSKKFISQLWKDKGLKQSARDYWGTTGYSQREAVTVLLEWSRILYPEPEEAERIVIDVMFRQFGVKNPATLDEIFINKALAPLDLLVPRELDKKFGPYMDKPYYPPF